MATSHIQRTLLVFLSLLLFLLSLFSKPVSLTFHFFFNIFFFGNSNAKLLMFLLYFPLLLVAPPLICRISRFLADKKVLWSLLLVNVLLSLFSFFNLLSRFDLDLRSFPLFVLNGSYDTASHLLHMHTYKPSLTFPLRLFGFSHVPRYGDGLTFYDFQPSLYIIGGIFLSLMMFSFIAYSTRGGKKPRNLYSTFLYALFSFGLLKSLLDGGVFWYEFIFSLYFFALISSRKFPEMSLKKVLIQSLLVLCGVLLFYLIYYFFVLNVKDATRLFNIFMPPVSMFLGSLGLLSFSASERSFKFLGVITCVAMVCLQIFSPSYKGLIYAFKKVPAGSTVYLSTEHPLDVDPAFTGVYINTYKFTSKGSNRLLDYILRYDLRLLYYPLNIAGITCSPNSSQVYNVVVRVLEGDVATGLELGNGSSHKVFSRMTLMESPSFYETYTLEYKPKGCHPNIQALLAEETFTRGVKRGLIISTNLK